MKKIISIATFIIFAQICNAQFKYPPTTAKPVTDDYNGTKITDNYRWLEDMKNPDVETWFKSQADYSDKILNKISGRDNLYNDMMAMSDLEEANYSFQTQYGNVFFYIKTIKGEKVGKLYRRVAPNGKEELLFDPLNYKAGKTFSISDYLPSNDAKNISLGLSESGAEVGECRILNVATKQLLPEIIAPVWGGANEWTKDNKAVIYAKLSNADNTSTDMLKNLKTNLHIIGTDVSTDKLIASKDKYSNLPIKEENWVNVNFSSD